MELEIYKNIWGNLVPTKKFLALDDIAHSELKKTWKSLC
jgi:hypothetical protein